jgi:hypothetical protein
LTATFWARILVKITTFSIDRCSVGDPDPGSGIRCLFDPWIRDPGWVKYKDHIFESLETIFWVKILKFFDADADPRSGNLFDPRSGIEKIRIGDIGSGMTKKSDPR